MKTKTMLLGMLITINSALLATDNGFFYKNEEIQQLIKSVNSEDKIFYQNSEEDGMVKKANNSFSSYMDEYYNFNK